jgi:uncharacterized membrane protein
MATSTKKLITLRINNSIFRKNYVWNRENCPYDYPESGDNADCYFSEYEVREKKLKDPIYEFCNPSSSDHGVATVIIIAPMYYNCKTNYGNCYGSRDPSFFVTNSIFEENSGGQRGLFDLRCVGAVFENNKFINNWSTDTGLMFMFDTLLTIKNDEVKDQRSYWGNSNALYQISYTDMNITDSNFENIESQTSSIINVITGNCKININNSNFINTIFPYELSSSGSSIRCVKCMIKDIKRSLSKNKPTIGKTIGVSSLIFENSKIFNVTTFPLFKAIEESRIVFHDTSIYDITLIGNIGLIDAVTSSSIIFLNSEIYSINFKRILDTASFIKFSSSGTIVFNNTNVHDSNIDGNFMSISSGGGENISLLIEGSNFKNINVQTGSIIKIENNECKFQISNSNFLDNKRVCEDKMLNNYMTSCPGIIEIETNISESMIDGCNFKNNTAGIGPALTINNVEYVDLDIQNSKFIKNYGTLGGGAIYILGINYTYFSENSLKMRNLEFIENSSNSGGAIFINFPGYNTETIENSTFVNNKAYNGGAVFYFPYYIKENQPKLDELCKLDGNKALYGGDYSSDPYKIELMNNIDRINTYSGESVKSYTFVIKDEYGNPILTNFKDSSFSLQSMLFLKAVILDKAPEFDGMYDTSDISTDAEIIGESFGYFQNGTCSFGMQFYQKDNIERDYKLWVGLSLSAYSLNDVYLMLDLHMEPCPEGLILEEENKSRFKGCIYAKCEGDNECVEDQGQCIDNDICKCYDGFEGKRCENKIFFKLSEGLQRYSITLAIFGIIFTVICLLFIFIRKDKFIIKMSGMSQLACLALGCILSFSSIIADFREPTNYSCALREVLLNIGFIIIYSIFYFKMYYYIINNVPENLSFSSTTSQKSYHQGESKAAAESSMKVSRFEMSMDVKSGFNFTSTMNQGNDLLKQTNQTKKEVESIANNLFRKQYIDGLKKSFNRIYGFILVLFTICLVITVTLYLRESLEESQTSDSRWAYECESKEFAPITFAVHLLLLLILITNIKKCWALSTMYAETKHICYSLGIYMSIGPLIQIICVAMLNQNPMVRYVMMINSIFISQFIIVFFMLGLKVLAILRGAGDTRTYTNSKLTQFYNEPTVAFNNNNPEDTTNSFRQ